MTNFAHSEMIDVNDEETEVDESSVSNVDETNNTDDSEANLTIEQDVQNLLLEDEEYNSDVDDDDDYESEEQPTPQQELRAASIEFNDTLEKIINDADSLAKQESNETVGNHDYENDLPVDELTSTTHKTVLADIFHLMDRAKLPIHHEYKSLFFRALRASVFIMNDEDVDDVKRVLQNKPGITWEKYSHSTSRTLQQEFVVMCHHQPSFIIE